MHWREVVVRHAARVLDDAGLHEEAARLRELKIPLSDGGGLRIAQIHRDGSITASSVLYQSTETALSRPILEQDTIALSLFLEIQLVTKLVAECRLPAWLTDNAGGTPK